MACADIQARTCPACQAVTRALNLVGFGNLPNFTIRHSVGAENGRGAMALSGLFGLRTSCASRSQALSGSASKTDGWMVAVAALLLDAIGSLGAVSFCDICCLQVDEGLTISFHRHQRWQLPN
jgi:hypothetical protein